jgi:hypothetical protein
MMRKAAKIAVPTKVPLTEKKLWVKTHVNSPAAKGKTAHAGTTSRFTFKSCLAPVTAGLLRNDCDSIESKESEVSEASQNQI